MSQTQNLNFLYDQDILLWSEDTVAKLKARDFDHLDIEHLIELAVLLFAARLSQVKSIHRLAF